MTFEELMEEALSGNSPGDKELMRECARIVDARVPAGMPRLSGVVWPLVYFMEGMHEDELRESYASLYRFCLDLAKAADKIQQEGGSLTAHN